MSRDAVNRAKNTYNTASGVTTDSSGNSNALYGQLAPAYSAEATAPTGLGAKGVADLTTAAAQTAGGATGAAEGASDLLGASNRNSGSFAPALDDSARGASRQLSTDVLGVKTGDDALKEQQRQEGLSGLSGLQQEQNNNVLSSLGLQDQAVNSEVNAGNSGWFQNMLGAINAVTGAGKSAAAVNNSFNGGGGGGD